MYHYYSIIITFTLQIYISSDKATVEKIDMSYEIFVFLVFYMLYFTGN